MKRSFYFIPLLCALSVTPALAHDATCDWGNATTLIGCLHNTKHSINNIWSKVVATGSAVIDTAGNTVMTVAKQTKATGEQTLETLEQVGEDVLATGNAVIDEAGDTVMMVAKQTRDTGQQTLDTLEQVGENVLDTMTNTFQVRETIQFMQDAIDTMDAIAGEIERMAFEAEDMLVYFAAHELDEYSTWAGTTGCGAPCEGFRGQLVQLVIGMQDATNTLIDMQHALIVQAEPSTLGLVPRLPHVDYTPLADQLLNIPGAVLYPLYKGMKAFEDLPGSGAKVGYVLPAAAPECEGCTEILAFINSALYAVYSLEHTPEILGAMFGDCPSIMQPQIDGALTGFSAGLKLAGVPLKFVAVILKAKGHTSVAGTHGGLAAAGHLSLRLEHNFSASLGTAWGGLADFALAVASAIDNKLRHCEIVVNQLVMLCMLDPPRPNDIPRGTTLTQYCQPDPMFPDL